jgi:hypothetical protein
MYSTLDSTYVPFTRLEFYLINVIILGLCFVCRHINTYKAASLIHFGGLLPLFLKIVERLFFFSVKTITRPEATVGDLY